MLMLIDVDCSGAINANCISCIIGTNIVNPSVSIMTNTIDVTNDIIITHIYYYYSITQVH